MSTKYVHVTAAILISLTIFSSCDFRSKATKSNKFCETAHLEFVAKDYKNALVDYRMAASIDTTNGLAFEGKGSAEYQLDVDDSALRDEMTALRLNPDLKKVRNWIATIKSDMQDYRGAIQYFNKSLEVGNNLVKDYEGRGEAYYYLNDYDRAMKDETKAIQLDSATEEGYYWRARIKTGLGDYKGAIDDHLKSIAIGAKKGLDYEGLSLDENYLGDKTKALEYISMAITSDTSLKTAYAYRARIRQDMEDYKGSIDDYTLSIKKRKNNSMDYEGRAVSEYYLKDYTNALNDINIAVKDTALKKAQEWKELIEKDMHNRG